MAVRTAEARATRLVGQCLRELQVIADNWEVLRESLEPSTAKKDPETRGLITGTGPDADAVQSGRDEREERPWLLSRGLAYLATSRPPADLDVLSATDEAVRRLATAHDTARLLLDLPRRCSRCGQKIEEHEHRPDGAALARCHEFRRRVVPAADPSWSRMLVARPEIALLIADEIKAARVAVQDALIRRGALDGGPEGPGRLLMAPCPACRGITQAMPSGSLTLKAFLPEGGAVNDVFVSCMNPECEPGPEWCDTWWNGRPAWTFHELEWLISEIDAA